MTEILSAEVSKNGGSNITSYSLEWDWGTNGAGYVALTGLASNSM